jgi:hypothetical protein
MNEIPKLDLHRLKAVVTRLLDEAIAEHGSANFELQENLYWQIAFAKQFDMSSPPIPDEVGSLHDDWEMTHWLADEPTKVGAFALTEVASLLAYVGNKLAPSHRPT